MKVKIVDTDFNDETGISKVVIRTKKGDFVGTSKLQEADKERYSLWTGYCYAELKARIKALNVEIKELKIQLSAFEQFYNNIAQAKLFDSDSFEARKIRRKMYELRNKIETLQDLRAIYRDKINS